MLGRMSIVHIEIITYKFCQFYHKMCIFVDDAIYDVIIHKPQFENDVITTDVKSSYIRLLNYYSQFYAQPFSYLDKLTGPNLQFVVLALCYRKQVVLPVNCY